MHCIFVQSCYVKHYSYDGKVNYRAKLPLLFWIVLETAQRQKRYLLADSTLTIVLTLTTIPQMIIFTFSGLATSSRAFRAFRNSRPVQTADVHVLLSFKLKLWERNGTSSSLSFALVSITNPNLYGARRNFCKSCFSFCSSRISTCLACSYWSVSKKIHVRGDLVYAIGVIIFKVIHRRKIFSLRVSLLTQYFEVLRRMASTRIHCVVKLSMTYSKNFFVLARI